MSVGTDRDMKLEKLLGKRRQAAALQKDFNAPCKWPNSGLLLSGGGEWRMFQSFMSVIFIGFDM
jgi:hypothetical protein